MNDRSIDRMGGYLTQGQYSSTDKWKCAGMFLFASVFYLPIVRWHDFNLKIFHPQMMANLTKNANDFVKIS